MSKIINIRLAIDADIKAINQISNENGMSDGSENNEKLEPMDSDNIWIVLEENSQVVGGAYLGLEGHSDKVWNLYFLAVKKEFQGKGRGTSLVKWVENYLQNLGSDRVKIVLIDT